MYNLKNIINICNRHNAAFLPNEILAPYTSFKIGGSCLALIKINGTDVLKEILACCRVESIPYYILGKGSNVLISDKGYNGLVFIISNDYGKINIKGESIECEAGASLKSVCLKARDNSLTGLEFAYGIPGTVGGAVYMNAGAYGGEMGDCVSSCCYIDSEMNIKEIKRVDLDFSYRHSFFSNSGNVILSVNLELKQGEPYKIETKMNELMEKRRTKQPLEFPSAGSTFKRPNGDYASRLIENCGLKGVSCGGAEISAKHSGFVINKGGATFDDVINLINIIKEKVNAQTGIMLECEVEILK